MNLPITSEREEAVQPHCGGLGVIGMAFQIADEAARTDIECHALIVSAANPSVYDIGALEPNDINDEEMEQADMAAIARAVTYLEARGLLRRPVDDAPNLVSFA